MSQETNGNEIDLIDFDIKSPVLPRATPTFESCTEETSDNLLDTELPVLEKKLQATENFSSPAFDHKNSVDIEDILIAFDDDIDYDTSKDTKKDSCDQNILENHVELLDVLKNLDDVLNACLKESDDDLDRKSDSKQYNEDLHNLDSYSDNDDPSDIDLYFSSNSQSPIISKGVQEAKDDLKDIRTKLGQYEKNYNKFLSSGYVNRGYVNSELGDRIYRSVSASNLHNQTGNIDYPKHATVGAVKKRRIPLHKNKDQHNGVSYNTSLSLKTKAESDDNIDWSWLEDVARDISLESCENESSNRVSVEDSPSASEAENAQNTNAIIAQRLRDSMRRLDPLLMPYAASETEVDNIVESQTETVTTAQPSFHERLVASSTDTSSSRPTNVRNSRSRSCDSHGRNRPSRGSFSSTRSRRPRSLSSSLSSASSSAESSPSFNPSASPTDNNPQSNTPPTSPRRSTERNRGDDMPEVNSPLGNWPHSFSSMMACLSCTLGLFNICRFAILSVHFGANFIVQFVFLSLVFGLPLLTLQLCLGQILGAGVVDMWRISPIFQGVGIALLIGQLLTGLYSVIGVSWLFVYFRDSFITKIDNYRWAEPYIYYRKEIQYPINGTYKISETVPDYFNGVVLQRHHISLESNYGTIKFQLAFNLAVVWMIVFVSLSKGLRSYGKVVYAFTLLPVFGMFMLFAKIFAQLPTEYLNGMFPETNWSEFFLNPKCWIAAAQETFLTWGLLGAAVMQIASHNKKHKHSLHRDSSLAAITTMIVLLLAAFMANTCVDILKANGYSYLPSSFEQMSSYTFLRPAKDPLPPNLANTPVRYMTHNLFIAGDRIIKSNMDVTVESGYQVLRFATELIPATFAILGADQMSPFWAVLFYFTLIMFGIAQQLAMWHCVITGIIATRTNKLKEWETTITFFSCACGFLIGLPMATELGIYVVYFFDYTVGGMWWLIIIFLFEIIAVFMVRGRPYSGDKVVMALFNRTQQPLVMSWAPALLSFTWNVVLPVGLMVLCICTFKNGNFKEMFVWHHAPTAEYWPLWSRQLGSLLQLLPIMGIPLVALIQSYRYLNNGPNDIFDRIQLLYRPPIGEHMDEAAIQEAVAAIRVEVNANAIAMEDPPPKYTPPPSYTTATGARLAKLLSQTLRRSIRRIANVLGESTRVATRQRTSISNNQSQSQYPPPEYNTVIVEMNSNVANHDIGPSCSTARPVSTLERLRNLQSSPNALTAAEVASILRNSLRRSTLRPRNQNVSTNFNVGMSSMSAQNLVSSAAPIGETSLVNNQNAK